jgi:hypothetical protein
LIPESPKAKIGIFLLPCKTLSACNEEKKFYNNLNRIFSTDKKRGELALNPKFHYEMSPRSQLVRNSVLLIQGLLVKNPFGQL